MTRRDGRYGFVEPGSLRGRLLSGASSQLREWLKPLILESRVTIKEACHDVRRNRAPMPLLFKRYDKFGFVGWVPRESVLLQLSCGTPSQCRKVTPETVVVRTGQYVSYVPVTRTAHVDT